MVIVGERINSSRPPIAEAIQNKDDTLIKEEAVNQAKAGADYIDVNAGIFFHNEAERLSWLVQTVQSVTDKPLCIDTANAAALQAALKVHKGQALVNSVTMETESVKQILPIIKTFSCRIIGLAMDDSGIPKDAGNRLSVAKNLIHCLIDVGIPEKDIFIDPLVHTVSTDSEAAVVTLDSIRTFCQKFSTIKMICGASNVSFGLPGRYKINRAFLVLAVNAGIDAAIIDPTDKDLMMYIKIANMLSGRDEFCSEYIAYYKESSADSN